MKRSRFVRLLLATAMTVLGIVTASVASAPTANAAICASFPCSIQLSYYGPFTVHHPQSDEALDKTLCSYTPTGDCIEDLEGYLFLPHGTGIRLSKPNLPLVIAIHGSTPNSESAIFREMARYFNVQQFAFFNLERRGHGISAGQDLDGRSCDADHQPCTAQALNQQHIDDISAQVFEVRQAINYMKSLHVGITYTGDPRNGIGPALVNPGQIAILGHSVGGLVTLFANTENLGQRTAIDIAGGSLSWRGYDQEDIPVGETEDKTPDTSPTIRELEDVAGAHVTPPMFLQPLNDCSTRPTVHFAKVLGDQNQIYESTLFGPVPISSTDCHDAHIGFVMDKDQVQLWGPQVQSWLHRNGVG